MRVTCLAHAYHMPITCPLHAYHMLTPCSLPQHLHALVVPVVMHLGVVLHGRMQMCPQYRILFCFGAAL